MRNGFFTEVFMRNGLYNISHSIIKTNELSFPKNHQGALWPHRLGWLETPAPSTNLAATQYDAHHARMTHDPRGFARDPEGIAAVIARRRSASESPKRSSPVAA